MNRTKLMKDSLSIPLILVLLLLNITCFIGVFIAGAYLSAADDKMNSFSVGNNVTEIVENYEEPAEIKAGDEIVKEVSVKNTGKNDCYVRVLAVFSDSDVTGFASLNIDEVNWSEGDDGYYYYKKVLRPGGTTENLFTRVSISQNAEEEQIKGFEIYVYAESRNVESGGFS